VPALVEAMAVECGCTTPSLRQRLPDLPWSLESIVGKCLAPDPEQRYQQAEQLAEDLRCFLEDRPLQHAHELSRSEQVRKWLRRHPRLTSSGSVVTVAALVLAALGAALFGVRQHLQQTREQLNDAQAREREQTYADGTVRALCLVNTASDLHEHLPQGVAVCEQTLGLYGVLDRTDWQAHTAWERLPPAAQRRLAEDTRELLLLLAWARVRLGAGDKETLRQALALLDRAEAVRGLEPSKALCRDRADYLSQLGEAERARSARAEAERLRPAGPRDHYLLATAYVRKGGPESYALAMRELNEAIRLNPQHYWSWVQRGICYQEQGEYLLAAGDFGVCIGLWPDCAWGYFNRGYAFDRGGHKAQAVSDYTAALERDPRFLLAHVNRGLARLELRQFEQALADFQHALTLGRDDAFVHAGRGMALEALGRPHDADAAFQAAFTRARTAPENVRTRIRWVYGFAIARRLPDKAQEAFAEVLRHDPQHPQALYGQAMLGVEHGRPDEALQLFNQALAVDSSFVDARRARAILLARLGHFDQASQDINWCLDKEPHSGPTLYAAACVTARAAEKLADPNAASQALGFLERALRLGHGRDRAAADPDLAGIRQSPRFRQLLEEAERRHGPQDD
jgi:tetratricopeptide (TPR) repeat protein